MTLRPEIVVVPLDSIPVDLLAGVQRAIFRNFRRSTEVMAGFFFEERTGGDRDMGVHITDVLPTILVSATTDPEIVVFLSTKDSGDQSTTKVVGNPDGPRLLIICLHGFPNTISQVRGVIHTLGHHYGLPACYIPGCVMNPGGNSFQDPDRAEEPSLCPECSQGSLTP